MSDKELFETKIALSEQRMENRLVSIESKIDRLSDAILGLDRKVDEVKQDNKGTRTTIIITIIGAVLATLDFYCYF